MTDRQNDRHTNGHGDSKTNSAKRAELVKIYIDIYKYTVGHGAGVDLCIHQNIQGPRM